MYMEAVRGSKACTWRLLEAARHVHGGCERQQGMYLKAVRGSKACT